MNKVAVVFLMHWFLVHWIFAIYLGHNIINVTFATYNFPVAELLVNVNDYRQQNVS